MKKVIVYILPTRTPTTSKHLFELFDRNRLFRIAKTSCLKGGTIGVNDSVTEANQVIFALENSRKNFPDNYTIIIKDTSVTNSTPHEITKIVLAAIELNRKDRSKSFSRYSDISTCDTSSCDTSSTCDTSSCDTSSTCDSSSCKSCKSSYSLTCDSSCDCDTSDRFCDESYRSKRFDSSYSIQSFNCRSGRSDTSDRSDSDWESFKSFRRKKGRWDLCYLCKWLDRCDLYKTVKKVNGVPKIVKTESPLGIQAIMFSPKGRDIVLGKKRMKDGNFFPPIRLPLGDQLNFEIGEGNLKATCIIPNLFDFNVLLAKDNLDFFKLSECRQGNSEIEEDNEGVGFIPFFWFVAVTVGIILIAWFFYQFVAKNDGPSEPDIKRIRRAG